MAAIAKKPKQTNGLPNPVYVTPALQEQPNELRTNLGDSLVIPTTKAPSITALNSPDYVKMRVDAQNANTAAAAKTAANLTGIPAAIDTYSDAIDKNASIANNAGAVVAAIPAALENQVKQAVGTRQNVISQAVAPIAKPVAEVADDFGNGLAGVRTTNVDATAPAIVSPETQAKIDLAQKTAIATKPVESVTAAQPQVGTQNVAESVQSGGVLPKDKLSTSRGSQSVNGSMPIVRKGYPVPFDPKKVQSEEIQQAMANNTAMVGQDLTGRGIYKGVGMGKNGTTLYSNEGVNNSAGVTPSVGSQPQKRLTEEQVRQLYRELPADSFSAAGMGGTTAAQRYETQQQPQNRLNIAQPVDPNAQRNALIAQTKQSGNIGDKAVREAAMAQLQALDANARAEQDNQYKMAALGQNASQFEQQQQAAMATAKNTATNDERNYQLKLAEQNKPFDVTTDTGEVDTDGKPIMARQTMVKDKDGNFVPVKSAKDNASTTASRLSNAQLLIQHGNGTPEQIEAAKKFIANYSKV